MAIHCPIHIGPIDEKETSIIATPCGHVFCQECMTNHIQVSLESKGIIRCPMCQKKFNPSKNLTLYLTSGSPNSSPTRSQGKLLRDYLRKMGGGASVDEVEQASKDMDAFSQRFSQSEDIHLRCLALEIKESASTFREILIQELSKLRGSESENTSLKADKTQLMEQIRTKDKELTNLVSKRRMLEKDLANLKGAKAFSDQKLEKCQEELKACQNTFTVQLCKSEDKLKETINALSEKEEGFTLMKGFSAENKLRASKLKQRVKELEQALERYRSSPPVTPMINDPESFLLTDTLLSDLSEDEFLGRSHKRPKIQLAERIASPRSLVMDKSCFPFAKKPTSSKSLLQPAQRSLGGPLAIRNGQLQGAVTLGTRKRLGKSS